MQKLRDFEGKATVELVGLPANTTAKPVEFTKDTTELDVQGRRRRKTPSPTATRRSFA